MTDQEWRELARLIRGYLLLFMGPNGSGKGTQESKMKEKLGALINVQSISVGEQLRLLADDGSDIGLKIKKTFLDKGDHAPNDFTRDNVVVPFLKKVGSSGLAILDGFPRNVGQVEMIADIVKQKKTLAIVFKAKDEVCLGRTLKRIMEGSDRSDDTIETAKKRLRLYRQNQPQVEMGLKRINVPILYLEGESHYDALHEVLVKSVHVVVRNGFPHICAV